ncbi:MAG: hypothetical protein ABS35_35575 [Kaistia sp. SCN 65-12]|nr:MAG: hypothetical protein ABS35_35575 [Kaistia sp. SCN 65-12]
MGYWSEQHLKMFEGGVDLRGVSQKYVCADCLIDELNEYVKANLATQRCDYCGKTTDGQSATNVGELVRYILVCIEQEWADAEHELPKDDETGDWMLGSPVDTVACP